MKHSYTILSVILLLFTFSTTYAQKKRIIMGKVENRVTHEPLSGTKVLLLNATDSTVLDSMITECIIDAARPKSEFYFENVIEGNYIIRFEKENYETLNKEFHLTKEKRGTYIDIGRTMLRRKRKEIELGNVKVTATKVKIYFRGDTVIYNADAFQLSEGSMLDALIRQIPGAVLKDDGRILVNGKQVESLLLNGKDFFKGDNNVMLDNLPSYMVNNIKVYEKESEKSSFVSKQVDEKQLVMDVTLKKQYSIGWISNAETGIGSENRYLGRLFAMRFTSQSRVSFFGSINNLNDSRKPGVNGEWSPANLGNGLKASKQFGLDYSIDDRNKFYKVEGNILMEHLDTDDYSETNSTNFLTGGNTYGYSKSLSKSCHTTLNTNHTLLLTWNKVLMNINTSLDYKKYNRTADSFAGTLSQNLSDYSNKAILDSIFAPNAGALIRNITLNRTIKTNLTDGHHLSSSFNSYAIIKTNQPNKVFLVSVNGKYDEKKEDYFSHYLLDYPSSNNKPTDFRNQYGKTPFTQNYHFGIGGSYIYFTPKGMRIEPFAGYSKTYNNNAYSLYRLDSINGWENGTAHTLGELPSVTEYLSKIDRGNSYISYNTDYTKETGLRYNWEFTTDKKKQNKFEINAELSFTFDKNEIEYQRAAIDTSFSRQVVFFKPLLEMRYVFGEGKRNLWFNYNKNSSAPSMIFLINSYRDDANPLYITLANKNLRNTHKHNFSAGYDRQIPNKQRSFSVNFGGTLVMDEVVMGSVYNRTTGVRTYTPENVNGNWNIYGVLNYATPLDKPKRLAFSTYTTAQYYNNVDLTTVENSNSSRRSKVNTFYLTETMNLDYRFKKFKMGTKLSGTWVNAASRREDFTGINAFDFNYGLTGQIELPWNIQVSTDLTVYSRRGYEDKAMNTNDFVWNARLSKRILKGNLTFMLDGFDILNNLSNITRTINAQGRTETYRNVIPSYVMLHAIYRLNIKPKKKAGE